MRLQTDTKALVLSVLAQGPKHGYGVAKAVREQSDGVLKLGEGQLYPILYSLEEAGWVTASWESEGEQGKRTYAITEEGRAELAGRVVRWDEFAQGVAKILANGARTSEAGS